MEPPPPVREYHREPPGRGGGDYHRERDPYPPPPRDAYPPPSSSRGSGGDPYHGHHGHREDLPPPSRSSGHHHRGHYDPYDDYREGQPPPSSSSGRLPPPSPRSLPYKILCVANLNSKVSDSSIRDALIHEFARFGEVSVKIIHDSNERFAYLYFRCYEDAREARHAKYRLVLFDKPVEIDPIYEKLPPLPPPPPPAHHGPHHSSSSKYGPPPIDGYHRSSRRSLTPPDYHHGHHSRSRSPSYRSSARPLPPPPPSSHHHPSHLAPPPPSGARVDRYGNPYPVRSHPRDSLADRDRYPNDYHSSSSRGDHHHHPYESGRSRGAADPYDRNPMSASSSSRLPSSPNASNGTSSSSARPGTGGASGSAAGRENKKDKFPNYLHHVAPEEDANATRTLFVGNLEVSIADPELRRIFEKYGVVEDIDVKRPPPGQGNAYAFIKFLNLDMAHRAKVEMSGQYIGKFQCKIGYGKATPTTRIWVGGLGSWTSLSALEHEFDRFGAIGKIDFVKGDNHAYILFDSIDAATAAIQEMRGFPLGGQDKRLRVDFADPGVYSGEPGQEPTTAVAADGATVDTVSNGPASDVPLSRTPPLNSASGAEENGNNRSSPNGSVDSRASHRRPADGPITDEATDAKRSRIMTPDGEASNDSSTPLIKTDLITFNDRIVNVSTISDLVKATNIVWVGGLKLKNSSFPCQMHHCSGDLSLVYQFMGDQSGLGPVNNDGGGSNGPSCDVPQDVNNVKHEHEQNNGDGDHGQVVKDEAVDVIVEVKEENDGSSMEVSKEGEEKDGAKDEEMKSEGPKDEQEKESKDELKKEAEDASSSPSFAVKKEEEPSTVSDQKEVKAEGATNGNSDNDKSGFLPLIKVTQRLRLDPAKLEDVSKRIKAAGSKKCLLLVSPAPAEVNARIPMEVKGEKEEGDGHEVVNERLSLRQLKNLISYFKARESAGVANLTPNSVHGSSVGAAGGGVSSGENGSGGDVSKVVMYCFPTCDYAIELIKKIAPNFNSNSSSVPVQEFLLVLLVKG